jgi:hypothetical protein
MESRDPADPIEVDESDDDDPIETEQLDEYREMVENLGAFPVRRFSREIMDSMVGNLCIHQSTFSHIHVFLRTRSKSTVSPW